MMLNKQKTIATVQIKADLTAAELDDLLRKLALLRAEMSPAVPASRDDIEETGTALVEDKPGLVIAARRDGGYRIWLRHRGYGWLAYQIDDRSAQGMADFIHARGSAPDVHLVSDENTHRH